jgi:hypothetical protein
MRETVELVAARGDLGDHFVERQTGGIRWARLIGSNGGGGVGHDGVSP